MTDISDMDTLDETWAYTMYLFTIFLISVIDDDDDDDDDRNFL